MRHRSLPPKAMWLAAGVLAAAFPAAFGQYPGHIDTQKKADASLRAVAILEWTGLLGNPSASRLIPIAVFDGETYQPGGLYLARPEPLALDSGTEYILQRAGVPQGLFDVNGSQEVQGYWLGYGLWRKTAPPPLRRLPQGKITPQVVKDVDDSRPHFKNRSGGDQPGGSSSQGASNTGSGSAGPGGSSSGSPSAAKPGGSSEQNPPSDPDQPVLVRRTSSIDDSGNSGNGTAQSGGSQTSSGTSSGGANSGPASTTNSSQNPPDDPDRPVLRRRTASAASDSPSYLPNGPETAIGGADPDRPRLTYGSANPEDSQTFEEPKLTGTPDSLQQMIAVSDATDREPHPFAYSWADPGDAAKMNTQMETLAQKALAPAPGAAAAQAGVKPSASRSSRTAAARGAHKAPAVVLPLLSDERFAAYQLTYDSGATLVFSAKSVDASGKTKYVTLIAQPDFYGVPHVIFTSVTEDGMLDLTPRMQLVDAVDARANNRGDLIFELRSGHDRQFAIYQVVEGEVQQVFVTGSLPLSPAQTSASSS